MSKKPSEIKKYLEHQKYYTELYGDKTIVFSQQGSFYESYATLTEGYQYLYDIAKIIPATVTRRDKQKGLLEEPSVSNPLLCGFPINSLRENLVILTDAGYIVVIFEQVLLSIDALSGEKSFDRVLQGIYKGNMHFNPNDNSINSKILAISYIVEKQSMRNDITTNMGLSLLDVTTGNLIVHEYYETNNDTMYEEICRIKQLYEPYDFISYYHLLNTDVIDKYNDFKKLLEQNNIKHEIYKYHNSEKYSNDMFKLLNNKMLKIPFQNAILAEQYGLNNQTVISGGTSPIEILELEKSPLSTISLVLLISYITKFNTSVLKTLSKPSVYCYAQNLIYGNDAISQLNIFDTNGLEHYNKSTKSLFDIINKTSSPLGKRYLYNSLRNPISKECTKTIKKNYNTIEKLLEKKQYKKYVKDLTNIYDLDKIHRQIRYGNINPNMINKMLPSYEAIMNIIKLLKKYEPSLYDENIMIPFEKMYKKYTTTINIEVLNKYNDYESIIKSIFNKGIYKDIDELESSINSAAAILDNICSEFKKFLPVCKSGKEPINTVCGKKNGYHLITTTIRADLIKKKIKNHPIKITTKAGKIISIKYENLVFESFPSGKKVRIFVSTKNNLLETYTSNQLKLNEICKNTLNNFIFETYVKYKDICFSICNFISKFDFLVSGAIIADDYSYCKPTICKSNICHINAKGLRNAIIERILKATEYIPNDIEIGNKNKQNGILLFGPNAAGKSSLMKSIGIAVVLAQIGYYVPATTFEYVPYMSLYVRIMSNDNIYKSQSSFVLEMNDIQSIISRVNNDGPNTLVLGDEICKGTEYKSARKLVAATLIKLATTNSTFMFASHMHKICDNEKVKLLNNMRICHMKGEYNTNLKCYVYERKMYDGCGPKEYGIDVAKYIIKDTQFWDSLASFSVTVNNFKASKYNSESVALKCALCSYKPIESKDKPVCRHHINFQSECVDGKIKSKKHIKKNALSNLVPLCDGCHDLVHDNKIKIKGYIDTSIGPILFYDL
jgi:DNA mismatch repair protein MutS